MRVNITYNNFTITFVQLVMLIKYSINIIMLVTKYFPIRIFDDIFIISIYDSKYVIQIFAIDNNYISDVFFVNNNRH